MDESGVQQRLSQIETRWTIVKQAHLDDSNAEIVAQTALIERYQGAVYRYLLGAARDPDVADELFQEFALRVVRGDFHRADASRGRFRDYVKTTLINLVISHSKKKARQPTGQEEVPEGVAPPAPPMPSDEEFLANWRKAVLDRAWEALAAAQKPGGPPFARVLRFRTDHPDLPSGELAKALTAELKPAESFTDAGVRKILQRAREMFTDLLVAEVSRSLQNADEDALEQELIDLGFHAYCKKALDRRRQHSADSEA
jgi:DNA-directed RNA polymerase specialized sigma24 family protein